METRKKILLVDDDVSVLSLLSARLAPHYDVLATRLPRSALALARAERPDVVLCDIDMPTMTGGEVAAELAGDAVCAAIPVIYLTALVTPEEAQELSGLVGGRPGVSKRAPLAELVYRIEEVARA